jgi:hypothetical protein
MVPQTRLATARLGGTVGVVGIGEMGGRFALQLLGDR